MGDDDVAQAVHRIHELGQAFVGSELGCGDQFHGLGERFVALREAFDPFVYGHRLNPFSAAMFMLSHLGRVSQRSAGAQKFR